MTRKRRKGLRGKRAWLSGAHIEAARIHDSPPGAVLRRIYRQSRAWRRVTVLKAELAHSWPSRARRVYGFDSPPLVRPLSVTGLAVAGGEP